MEQQLLQYLEPMDIPTERKDLSNLDNLEWIYRYLWHQQNRGLYEHVIEAMEITRLLAAQMRA